MFPAMSTPALACLGGEPASPELGPDLAILSDFPDGARRELPAVVAIAVRPELGQDAEAEFQAFANRHQLTGEGLIRPLRSIRLLFREAARRAVPISAFRDDLVRLLGDRAPEVGEMLLPHYEAVVDALRVEIVSGTLVDHGRVLVGLDYRVDLLKLSSRGLALEAPITWLTLRYREGDRQERVSLQVLPDELRKLRDVANEILGPEG